MAKEIKKIEKAAKALGYEVYRKTSKSHTLWQHQVTGALVLIAGTPSDIRSFPNTLSELRAGARATTTIRTKKK